MLTNVLNYHAGSGEIKPDSLHKAFCERVMSSGDTMRESFKRLDVDKSGSLDKQEIKRVFQAHNILYSDEEFDALYQQFDTNNDGLFCYSEFVKMLQASQGKK
jgi:Ca2+-binding EF-hand superfamily protein